MACNGPRVVGDADARQFFWDIASFGHMDKPVAGVIQRFEDSIGVFDRVVLGDVPINVLDVALGALCQQHNVAHDGLSPLCVRGSV